MNHDFCAITLLSTFTLCALYICIHNALIKQVTWSMVSSRYLSTPSHADKDAIQLTLLANGPTVSHSNSLKHIYNSRS